MVLIFSSVMICDKLSRISDSQNSEERNRANFSILHLFSFSMDTRSLSLLITTTSYAYALCFMSPQSNWEEELNTWKTSLISHPLFYYFNKFIENLLLARHCMRHKKNKVEQWHKNTIPVLMEFTIWRVYINQTNIYIKLQRCSTLSRGHVIM